MYKHLHFSHSLRLAAFSQSSIKLQLAPQSPIMESKQIRPPANPTSFPAHITTLLTRLHAESKAEEELLDPAEFAKRSGETKAEYVRDKFIALDDDKAQFVYSMARAIDARTIVEAGTSFGVSTIYLALAASENAKKGGKKATVVATEHEPTKAERARGYWKECGEGVEDVIDLREGDLRETLKENLEDVDLLLLDIWTPMVMPTIKLVQPKLRHGAIIIADNTLTSPGYDEFIEYTRDPANGFVNITLPYTNGLEMCIYLPK